VVAAADGPAGEDGVGAVLAVPGVQVHDQCRLGTGDRVGDDLLEQCGGLFRAVPAEVHAIGVRVLPGRDGLGDPVQTMAARVLPEESEELVVLAEHDGRRAQHRV
jgi:hypothetical protein